MLNVLIIDDEANIRKMLTVCLESRGHSVTTVSNGKDARTEADRQVFDLAFVDLRLGTESGLDLISSYSRRVSLDSRLLSSRLTRLLIPLSKPCGGERPITSPSPSPLIRSSLSPTE